jgi:transketolase
VNAARPLRQVYRDVLAELMAHDERVVCLDTDTGLFSGTDFGLAASRYVNLGIAEHVLMGSAAAMAADGWIPFVNTMAAFAGSRAVEAVKIDIAYNELPVRIAATHGGMSAGHLGPTHHALEDLAIMRVLPGMTVVVPADAEQTAAFLTQSMDLPGPLYLRLGRKATPELPVRGPAPVIGRIQPLRPGGDVLVAGCGPHPLVAALAAAEELAGWGIAVGVVNVHTIKPFDAETFLEAAAGVSLVVAVEDHWRTGGLGSAIAEVLTEFGASPPLARVGVRDRFSESAGDHEYLLDRYGVSSSAVATRIRQAIGLIPAEV